MIRSGRLAALALASALAIAPSPCPGQGGGGMGGFGMGGGMGGGGMGMGMSGMGGGGGGGMMRGAAVITEEWTVRIETAGNQAVTGRLRLASVAIECDLGLYELRPDKVKEVQFGPKPGESGVMMSSGIMAGPGIRREGTVLTATGEKIAGTLAIPLTWRVRTDLGVLTPDAQKIKTLAFLARIPEPDRLGPGFRGAPEGPNPAVPGDAQPPNTKPFEIPPPDKLGKPNPSKPTDPN